MQPVAFQRSLLRQALEGAERRMQLLRNVGYEVDFARSYHEVDSLVRHQRYDLVLIAFPKRSDAGKAASMCRKLELTTG